jgi:hypothetical protein
MSIQGGPDIVNDGLILHIDAGNIRSYVSGSSTIYDLSGNNNTGSLYNGVGYTDLNKGGFVFDGANDYIMLPPNFFDFDTGEPFTISAWFKTTSSFGTILGNQGSPNPSVGGGGYIPAIYIGNDSKVHTLCFYGGSVSTLPKKINDGVFHNVTVTYSGSYRLSYLDGIYCAGSTGPQVSYSSVYYYFIGAGVGANYAYYASSYFSGSINYFSYYNRALSANEVYQNYAALAGRFGSPIRNTLLPNSVVLDLDASNTSSYTSGSSVWYDLSGYNNTGSLINGPTFESSSASGSIVVDGTNDYIRVNHSDVLSPIYPFSIESWIYPTKNTGTQNVIAKSNTANSNQYIYPRTEDGWNTSRFYVWFIDNTYDILTASWPSINAWHHTVAVYDGAKMYIYIDGALASSKNRTGLISIGHGESDITIGNQPGYNEYYGGKIGKIKIYSYAMNATEVSQSYNTTKGRFGL